MEILIIAAKHFDYKEFGKREFDEAKLGLSASAIRNTFGSWSIAIVALRKALLEMGIQIAQRSKAQIQDELLFAEMRRIWLQINHRPSRIEWEQASPKYSYSTYRKRFNGWQNACLQFIEHSMGSHVDLVPANHNDISTKQSTATLGVRDKSRSRDIPLKLRLSVLDRDGYRCCLCGRSPAIERGVVLHLDHILPFSKGGTTTYENLQTLCADCNLGKGPSTI